MALAAYNVRINDLEDARMLHGDEVEAPTVGKTSRSHSPYYHDEPGLRRPSIDTRAG
jgi:hypothetical protein